MIRRRLPWLPQRPVNKDGSDSLRKSANVDSDDEALSVTRERLSPSLTPPANAPFPFHADPRSERSASSSAPTISLDDDESFTLESGSAGLESRLTTRAKVARGVVGVALVALVAFILSGGPSATLAYLAAARMAQVARNIPAPQQFPAFTGGVYNHFRAPPGASNIPTMRIRPAVNSAGTAYSCWVTPNISGVGGPFSPLRIYATTDAGFNWTQATTPVQTAASCELIPDGVSARTVALELNVNLADQGACALPTLYVSTDGAASWRLVPWPDAKSTACNPTIALENGRIFAWADTSLLPVSQRSSPLNGRIITSGDAGQTWRSADAGLDDTTHFAVVTMRAPAPYQVALLAQADVSQPASASILLQSLDSGITWQRLGELPGAQPLVIASNNPTATQHGGWGRLYELAQSETNGVADGPGHLYLATAYVDTGWTPLPLPSPLAGIAPLDPANAIQMLSVGPNEDLLALRGAFESNATKLNPAHRLWLWDVGRRSWLLADRLFPGNLIFDGMSWHADTLTFWVTVVDLGLPPIMEPQSVTFNADNVRQET